MLTDEKAMALAEEIFSTIRGIGQYNRSPDFQLTKFTVNGVEVISYCNVVKGDNGNGYYYLVNAYALADGKEIKRVKGETFLHTETKTKKLANILSMFANFDFTEYKMTKLCEKENING